MLLEALPIKFQHYTLCEHYIKIFHYQAELLAKLITCRSRLDNASSLRHGGTRSTTD